MPSIYAIFEKFYKKGWFSPAMLLVSRSDVGDKTFFLDNTTEVTFLGIYLTGQAQDAKIINKLRSRAFEGETVHIEYYHADAEKDVRVIKTLILKVY